MVAKVYHEKQQSLLCGVHALNTLFQGPYFDEIRLAEIGQELDRRERECMMEGGIESEDFLKFVAEDSGNVAQDGNFSIQVLSLALAQRNMAANRLNAPDAEAVMAASNPLAERAFICNLDHHWFTIVKIDGSWWNCNSLNPAPEFVSDTYLDVFLHQLRMERYTIFFVRCAGEWPQNLMYGLQTDRGRWWTPEEAAAATAAARKARVEGRNRTAIDMALERARSGAMTLRPTGPVSGGMSAADDLDDADLAAALQASLMDGGGASGAGGFAATRLPQRQPAAAAIDLGDDDDPELAFALAASLEAAGGGGGGVPQPGARAAAAQGAGPGPGAAAQAQAGSKRAASSSPDRHDEQAEAPPPEPRVPVPEEPEAGAPGAFDLAIRLPDGTRVQRRFAAENTVAEVAAFCASKGADMRRFGLAHQAIPGVQQQQLAPEAALGAAGIPRRCALMCVAAAAAAAAP